MVQTPQAPSGPEHDQLIDRLREEVDAALRCSDAKAAAAHVELANRYLIRLNSAARGDGAG